LSGVKGAKGCLSYSAGHLFPYKLVVGLLSKALDAGVNLQTHTAVTAVAERPDDNGYLALATTRGVVRAKNVLHAMNGYTSSLLPEFADKIIPVRGICAHIKPSKLPAPFLPNSYMIRWSEAQYEYLIPRLDGSIVVGGARSEFYHDLQSWYNNVNDNELIDSAKSYFNGYMQRVFQGWENSGAYTSKMWTGSKSNCSNRRVVSIAKLILTVMGYSSDGMPHLGAVPGRQNQFIVAGFTGHGMPQVFLSAKGVASMMIDNVDFQSTGIPKIYEATQARLDTQRNAILEAWEESQRGPQSKL
jgi:glycine/D-amino acid oxidase-like deaminating enzyme